MVESRLQIVVLACFSKTGESPLLSNVEAGAGASSLPPQQRELILPICLVLLRVGNKIKMPKTQNHPH